MKTLIAVLAVLLVGCASYQPATTSGKPEIVVRGASLAEIRRAVTLEITSVPGWLPRGEDASTMTFERQVDSVGMSVLYGSRYDANVFGRARFSILPTADDAHRVVLVFFAVGNRGSAFERETELVGEGFKTAERVLAKVRSRLTAER